MHDTKIIGHITMEYTNPIFKDGRPLGSCRSGDYTLEGNTLQYTTLHYTTSIFKDGRPTHHEGGPSQSTVPRFTRPQRTHPPRRTLPPTAPRRLRAGTRCPQAGHIRDHPSRKVLLYPSRNYLEEYLGLPKFRKLSVYTCAKLIAYFKELFDLFMAEAMALNKPGLEEIQLSKSPGDKLS